MLDLPDGRARAGPSQCLAGLLHRGVQPEVLYARLHNGAGHAPAGGESLVDLDLPPVLNRQRIRRSHPHARRLQRRLRSIRVSGFCFNVIIPIIIIIDLLLFFLQSGHLFCYVAVLPFAGLLRAGDDSLSGECCLCF